MSPRANHLTRAAGPIRAPVRRRSQVVKATVCKTVMQRFDSARRLQFPWGFLFGCVVLGFGCSDPPDPSPLPPPADHPRWSQAPWVQWAPFQPLSGTPVAVFVGEPGGALDRIVADDSVTTFLNDRFQAYFLPPKMAPDLPRGALFLDAQGCLLAAPFTPETPTTWIDQANAVVLALAEGRAARTPLEPLPSRFGFDLPPDHPLRARCGRPEPAHGPEIQP